MHKNTMSCDRFLSKSPIKMQKLPPQELFVSDHLANRPDTFFNACDFIWPGASGGIRVGYSGGVLSFGFGKMVEQDVESIF
jgi:hypothetical protein